MPSASSILHYYTGGPGGVSWRRGCGYINYRSALPAVGQVVNLRRIANPPGEVYARTLGLVRTTEPYRTFNKLVMPLSCAKARLEYIH